MGSNHNVELTVGEVDVFYCTSLVRNSQIVRFCPRPLQHLLRKIHSNDGSSALLACISAVPSEAAAKIKHSFIAEVRQQPTESGPFRCGL
jgi:hypothetical protein